jgi:hypothetical protein
MLLVKNTFPESYVNAANGLQLPEGAELEALYCQPSKSFGRSTKLHLTLHRQFLIGAAGSWFSSQSFNSAFNLAHVSFDKIDLYSFSLPLLYSMIYSALSFESG